MDAQREGLPRQGLAASFRFAFAGLGWMLRTQRNARIHAAVSVAVLAIGTVLPLERADWCCLLLCIGFVWGAEAFNTALELLADAACPEYHPLIGRAKDVAAGAVLATALTAAAIGLLILLPPLVAVWTR